MAELALPVEVRMPPLDATFVGAHKPSRWSESGRLILSCCGRTFGPKIGRTGDMDTWDEWADHVAVSERGQGT